jgi:hypothetical protein
MRERLEEIWYWLIGISCPYLPCGGRLYGWKNHHCRGTKQQQTQATVVQIRHYLEEIPASQFVYTANDLCNQLEKENL